MEYRYYFSSLGGAERELYSRIYSNVRNRADRFELKAEISDVKRIIKYVLMDNPGLFWFEGKWEAKSSGSGITVIPLYNGYRDVSDAEIAESVKGEIREFGLTHKSSVTDKIKAVYDWILCNVTYGSGRGDQNAAGAFIDKRALCKGIAKAFQYFMNTLGIPSFIVYGTIDGRGVHVWNAVCDGGEFYHVDVTVGYERFRGLFSGLGRNKRYPCFMVSDATVSKTHRTYESFGASCDSDIDIEEYLVENARIPFRMIEQKNVKYLDTGSTCTVFEVEGNGEKHALKVMKIQRNRTSDAVREIRISQMLSRTGAAVEMIDFEFDPLNNTAYMLFRYCESLASRRRRCGSIGLRDTVNIGIQLLEAMIICRAKSVYHLDIQPKNIYFNSSGRAILGDFGGARYAHELKDVPKWHGTPAFIAPEAHFEGERGEASEIYSLGIVLYSLINGSRLPFSNEGALDRVIGKRLLGSDIPPCTDNADVWEVIKKTCAFNKRDRFSTYEEALAALKKIQIGLLAEE